MYVCVSLDWTLEIARYFTGQIARFRRPFWKVSLGQKKTNGQITISGAASNEKFVEMAKFLFLCVCVKCILIVYSLFNGVGSKILLFRIYMYSDMPADNEYYTNNVEC